jgi:hypothetical protein
MWQENGQSDLHAGCSPNATRKDGQAYQDATTQ